MRAATTVLLAVAVALASAGVCPTGTPTPTATPTMMPYAARVNPNGLCPNTCPGWGGGSGTTQVKSGPLAFANIANQLNGTKSITNADTSDTIELAVPTLHNETWPTLYGWQAGVYTLGYSAQDMCGVQHTTSATLDYRCNNPPVVSAITTTYTSQTFASVQQGAEILLNAAAAYDLDSSDSLAFYWCLISHPSSSAGTITTAYENVGSYLRVPTVTTGDGYAEGYALLKPDYPGTYSISVVVSDGCNFVPVSFTVTVTAVGCCTHSAKASGANTITWASNTTMSYSSPLSADASTIQSCLPPDYILSTGEGGLAGTQPVFKSLYSPLYQDTYGNTVTASVLPWASGPNVYGCTWPGAANFNPAAMFDNGGCYCAPNNNTWDVLTGTNAYMRKADQTGPVASVLKTPGQLQFYSSLGSVAPVTSPVCGSTTFTTSNNVSSASTDIRIDTSKAVANTTTYGVLLSRPSTSWDATVSYVISNKTTITYTTTNTSNQYTFPGQLYCTVSVPQGLYNDTSVTVSYPTNSSLAQCLGYYTLTLSSTANDICPSAFDMIDVAVVCPYPPYVNVAVETETLLWDGTKFVQSTTDPTKWFIIDARDTPYSASLNYTLAITSAPAAHGYYGIAADLNPPSGPQTALVTYANGSALVLAGSFLPLRGNGAYTVTLFANDGCNTASSDSVTINTQCLPITNLAIVPSTVSASSLASPTYFQELYQSYIVANGTYTPGTNFLVQPNSSALNLNLTYAIKVVNRPTLFYGDLGYYNDPTVSGGGGKSYQCMRGANFNLSGYSGNGQNIYAVLQNITTNFQIGGTGNQYQFEVSILDGCLTAAQTFYVTPAACPNQPTYGVQGNYTTSVWANGSYTPVQFGLTGNTLQTGISVGWFLTKGPAAYAYPSAPIPVNTGLNCSAFSNSFTVNGYTTRSGDLWSPVAVQSDSGNATFWYKPPSVLPMSGQQMTAQIVSCQIATGSAYQVSFSTQCNDIPAFICLDHTTTCSATDPTNNVNGFGVPTAQAESVWDNTNGHFTPLFFSALANPGPADWNSFNDVITYQFLIKSAPTGSWWNVAFVGETLSFTFLVPDNAPGIFDDANGFVAINTAFSGALQSSVQAAINTSDATRVYVTNTSFYTAVGVYATIPSGFAPGYSIAPVCYTPGIGRTFTATVTFAVLPPTYFRSYSSQAVSAATNKHTITAGADVTPYNIFINNLLAESASLARGIATTAGYTVSNTATPAFSNQVTAANNFLLLTTSGVAGSAASGYRVATSIVPDLPGQYTLDVGIMDDCPGNPFVYLSASSLGNSLTATAVGTDCNTFTGVTVTQFTQGLSTWSNSSTKFGSWQYEAFGPAYTLVNSFSGSTETTQCIASGTCSAPSFAAPAIFTFNPNTFQTSIAAITLSATNGASFTAAISSSTAPTLVQGGELFVGCWSSPGSSHTYTSADLEAVTYFARFDTATASSTQTLTLPDKCLGQSSTDVVFVQFPVLGSTYAQFQVTLTNIYTTPSGYNNVPGSAPIYASLAAVGTSGSVPLASNVSSLTATNLALSVFFTTGGYPTNLPANSYSYTPTVTLSLATQPPSWAFATACPTGISGTATLSSQVTLQCPATAPTLAALAGGNVAFNPNSFHYNSATVQVSGVGPTVLYSDVSFSFSVTGAPAGSILSTTTLASYLLPSFLSIPGFTGYDNTTNQPIWSPVINNCTSMNETVYTRYWANGLPWYTVNSTLSGTTAASYALYIDPAYVQVSLAPWAVSTTATNWLANSYDDTNYPQYALLRAGSASFVPDISGTYTVTGTYNDQCNPVKALGPVTITAANCPTGTITIGTLNTAPLAISPSSSGRVLLQATITGLADYQRVSWTVTPPTGAPVPTLYDAKSLYPSFVAAVAGTYTATITVYTGCNVPVVQSAPIAVSCGYPALTPSTAVSQAVSPYRIGQTGTLTLPYVPGANGLNNDKIFLVGEPSCPANSSSWAFPYTVQYTCPSATYSVAVQSVFPTSLLLAAKNQLLQVTVKVNGQATIPPGLMDQLYSDTYDKTAININVVGAASVQCKNPYVSNAALGQITCRLANLAAALNGTTFLPASVQVSLLSVSSNDINANGMVTLSTAPMVQAASTSSLSPLGNGQVTLTGINLAFDTVSSPYFSAADTSVTIDGKPCMGVTVVGTPTLFSTQVTIACNVPAGYGLNLPVAVQVGFRNPTVTTEPVSYSDWSSPVYIFSYAVPLVNSIHAVSPGQVASTLGGYWYQASITNLGLAYNTVTGAVAPVSFPALTPSPYGDVRLQLGNNIPITNFMVVTQEATGQPALVNFWVPAGCGSGLDLRVFRRNAVSAVPAAATFSYASPYITTVGQPYVDATTTGCTRVWIEGVNFGSPANASQVMVTFFSSTTNASHGVCDDVKYQNGSAYVRVSCRVPANATAQDTVQLVNECGQVSTSAAAATLPTSINLAGCGTAYSVENGAKFSYGISAPLKPASSVVTSTAQYIELSQGGSWNGQVLSNGLFIGLVFPVILVFFIGYPLYLYIISKNKGSQPSLFQASGASSGGSDKTVTKGATRVTMNPVSFAPAPPVKPADAPGQVHDNL